MFGRQKDFESLHAVLESVKEELKVMGCIANWKILLIASSRLCRKRAIAKKIVLNVWETTEPKVWVLDLHEIRFLPTSQIWLWLGLGFGSNIFLLHCVSGVSFRVLLLRCGATQLRIILKKLTLSFEDIVPVWGAESSLIVPVSFVLSYGRKPHRPNYDTNVEAIYINELRSNALSILICLFYCLWVAID